MLSMPSRYLDGRAVRMQSSRNGFRGRAGTAVYSAGDRGCLARRTRTELEGDASDSTAKPTEVVRPDNLSGTGRSKSV